VYCFCVISMTTLHQMWCACRLTVMIMMMMEIMTSSAVFPRRLQNWWRLLQSQWADEKPLDFMSSFNIYVFNDKQQRAIRPLRDCIQQYAVMYPERQTMRNLKIPRKTNNMISMQMLMKSMLNWVYSNKNNKDSVRET